MVSDRFIRWQGYAIAQLTFAVNLFLGLSVGSFAFAIALVRDDSFRIVGCYKTIFLVSFVALAISIVVGCGAVVSRVLDFRYTARKVRADDKADPNDESGIYDHRKKFLGRLTWRLFWLQLITLAIGLTALTLTLLSKYSDKFW